jgi:hypothetical protein
MKEKSIDEMEIAAELEEGVVKEIGEPEQIETKFGPTYRIPIVVEIRGNEQEIGVFVREKSIERGVFHPRSNVYKLLVKYGCKKLKELVGKKVQIRIDNRGFYRFVV